MRINGDNEWATSSWWRGVANEWGITTKILIAMVYENGPQRAELRNSNAKDVLSCSSYAKCHRARYVEWRRMRKPPERC